MKKNKKNSISSNQRILFLFASYVFTVLLAAGFLFFTGAQVSFQAFFLMAFIIFIAMGIGTLTAIKFPEFTSRHSKKLKYWVLVLLGLSQIFLGAGNILEEGWNLFFSAQIFIGIILVFIGAILLKKQKQKKKN